MFLIIEERTISYHYPKDGFSYMGIRIVLKNNEYYLILDNGYYFSDMTKIRKIEMRNYTVCMENNYSSIHLYFYENDYGLNEYNIYKRKDVLISKQDVSHFVSNDKYLNDAYFGIIGGEIKTNTRVYVNGLRWVEGQKLNLKDKISIHGINIYVFEDFLYINRFLLKNKVNTYIPEKRIVHYENKKEYPFIHIYQKVKEYRLEELKEYIPPKLDKKELSTIWPNLIMVLSLSCIAAIGFYNSYLNDQPLLSRISLIVMPVAMAITSFIIPLFMYFLNRRKNIKTEKKHIESYLAYLDEYEHRVRKNIDSYLKECESYYFSLLNCNDKMFSLKRNDELFLNISLGKKVISYDFEYKDTGISKIDNRLTQIKNSLLNVEGYPLMFDVVKHKKVSIITPKEEKRYFFNRFLLELAYKHHYDDVLLAIYTKDESILNDCYNLPHLFNGSKRMTFNNPGQLRELETAKTDSKIILLMYDYCDVSFDDADISCLYFSEDVKKQLKNSDALIEYRNNVAYLYDKDKTKFSHQKEEIDLGEYFGYLGKLKGFKENRSGRTFCDLFDTEKIDEYYKNHDDQLKAYFGYGDQGGMYLDLHEKGNGPHGLIGGSTGSGKSELIVSLLLSLCIKYPPDYLNIVLIDYKGEGLSDSLSYEGKTLPHIVASVSNLDENSLMRLIVCLNIECKNRQKQFGELSRLSGASIMNLDEYLKEDYESYGLPKLGHLLIVVDEFAELKKNDPLQIKELISISRIGRSLGIHLILATQKPAGVIDEEIWSNSRFKIALRMFDERDSVDILKKPDAAYLSLPGSFLLQVDDKTQKYQSIYSKSDIGNHDPYKVASLDNTLKKKKEIKKIIEGGKSQGELFCQKIMDVCDREYTSIRKLDFMPPSSVNRSELCINRHFVFGISDDYINNLRKMVDYDISENILIHSGRKKEINTLLNTLNENERQSIVISSRMYINRTISDCLLYHETEDVLYLFDRLSVEDLDVCLVIEDLYAFVSYSDQYMDILIKLLKQSGDRKMNLICLTSNSSLSYRLISCFKNRVLINILDQAAVNDFYYSKSQYKASSYYYDMEPVPFVPVKEEDFLYEDSSMQKLVRHIPDKITPQILEGYKMIGYSVKSRKKIFTKGNILVTSLNETDINRYRGYPETRVELYDIKTSRKNNEDILWIGPGIFSQHLFITGERNELMPGEGIYFHGGTLQKVKVINSE